MIQPRMTKHEIRLAVMAGEIGPFAATMMETDLLFASITRWSLRLALAGAAFWGAAALYRYDKAQERQATYTAWVESGEAKRVAQGTGPYPLPN